MDYLQMTAPCGLDCFNCTFHLAHHDEQAMAQVETWSEQMKIPKEVMLCRGCRNHDGIIPLQQHVFGDEHRCAAYECAKEKGVTLCGECHSFPCDHLHPYADKADVLPHNTKVFNLCLIKRLGLQEWAESKAAEVKKTYFTTPWSLTR